MGRTITTSYKGICADCGADLPKGSEARYYGRGRLYGTTCHPQHTTSMTVSDTATSTTSWEPGTVAAVISEEDTDIDMEDLLCGTGATRCDERPHEMAQLKVVIEDMGLEVAELKHRIAQLEDDANEQLSKHAQQYVARERDLTYSTR